LDRPTDRTLNLPRVAAFDSLAKWEVGLAALALLLVTSTPYFYGYWSAPADKWFSGVVFNAHDTAQYLSWMRESGERVFIENKLTSEDNPAIYFNLHWFIPGRFAALTGLGLTEVYQLFRLIAVPLCVVAGYWFCGLFFTDPARRRFAFWLGTLTSGLGWLWVVEKYVSGLGGVRFTADIYTTPGNTFWLMLASPHLTFALALVLLTLGCAWLGVQRRDFRWSLAAAALALFLGLGHIYDLVIIWSVLGLWGVLLTLRDGLKRRTFASLFVVVAASAPATLYFAWVSSGANPVWQQALAQYDNLASFTPSPLHLLIFLGLALFAAAAGVFVWLRPALGNPLAALRAQSDRQLFLIGWLAANLVIIYLPLKFQVMLLLAIQFVLAMWATDFLFERGLPWLRARLRAHTAFANWTPLLLLAAVLPTNLYLLGWRVLELSRHDYPFYLHHDEVAAMRCLEANAQPDDVVLSEFYTGHYLPGLAGARAYYANAVMTLDYTVKRDRVAAFYGGDLSESARRAFLNDARINYVLHGPLERAAGSFDPGAAAELRLVFDSPTTQVYAVSEAASRWACP
jgi:hypothetical protein